MPLKLSVGISKKVGQPNYGSLGASCSVEFEVTSSLLHNDPSAFHREVQNAYTACAKAVHDELARNRQPTGSIGGCAGAAAPTQAGPNSSDASPGDNGNGGYRHDQNGHRPTERQMTYIWQLAGQINGLGVRRLETQSANRSFSESPPMVIEPP